MSSKIQDLSEKLLSILCHQKKLFFSCVYIKWSTLVLEDGVSVINIHENDNANKTLLQLLCNSDIKKRWVGKNLYDLIDKEIKGKYEVKNMNYLTRQQIRKYKIDRVRLIKSNKHSKYLHEDILIPIIMQSRLLDSKTIKFRTDLGFNQINLILKKEQSVIESIKGALKGEDIRI